MTKFHIRFLYKSTKLSFFAISIFIALLIFLSDVAIAQSFSLDLGQGGSTATERLIQLFLLVTVMALAPSILVMTTSFIRIVIVLSFLRTAMGAQQTPPNQVIMALALFLTFRARQGRRWPVPQPQTWARGRPAYGNGLAHFFSLWHFF